MQIILHMVLTDATKPCVVSYVCYEEKENRPAIGSDFRVERGRTVWLYECQFPKRNLLTIGKISVSNEIRRLKIWTA